MPGHERAVDLQDVRRHLPQVVERGVAGAEVVDRDPHAGVVQLAQRAEAGVAVRHGGALGDLDGQAMRVERRAAHRVQDGRHHVRVRELARAQVHREAEVGRTAVAAVPVAQPAARLADRPRAHLHDQAALLGDRKELVRRRAGRAPGAPTGSAPRRRPSRRTGGSRAAGSRAADRRARARATAPARSRSRRRRARASPCRTARCARRRAPWPGTSRRPRPPPAASGPHPRPARRARCRSSALSRSSAPPARSGCAISRCSRSATPTASSTPPIASHSTVNSSPPKRATVSSGPQHPLDARGHLAEHLVAGDVAEAVVDPLEPVHVQEVHGDRLRARAVRDRLVEPVTEERPVGQPGERVVQREPLELGLHALAVRDVHEGAEEERLVLAVVGPATTVISSRIQMTRPSARLIRYSWTSASPELAHSASALITRSASSGWSSRSHRPPSEIQSSCA